MKRGKCTSYTLELTKRRTNSFVGLNGQKLELSFEYVEVLFSSYREECSTLMKFNFDKETLLEIRNALIELTQNSGCIFSEKHKIEGNEKEFFNEDKRIVLNENGFSLFLPLVWESNVFVIFKMRRVPLCKFIQSASSYWNI